MTPSMETGIPRPDPVGQRYECGACGAQIEIVKPCTCDPPDQVFRCCSQDMRPIGAS